MVVNCVPTQVMEQMNQLLMARVTPEEVHPALKKMAPSKSPGPDSMSAVFSQKIWHIVGPAIYQACSIFFFKTPNPYL